MSETMPIESNTTSCDDINEFLWHNSSDYTSLTSTAIVFGIAYSFVITFATMGNLFVIFAFCRHKSLQSVRNTFIVSLGCSDIVVSIVSGTITPITAFAKVWLFGEHLCRIVPLIQGSSLCFSTLTLTSISIDRFILIIYPTKRPIQRRHAVYMVLVNLSIAIALSLPLFIQQTLVHYDQFCGRFCTEHWDEHNLAGRSIYGTIVFLIQFGVPLTIITFCYAMISIRLTKGINIRKDSDGQFLNATSSDQRRAALRRRQRTNRMLIAMVAVFVGSWTPSVLFNFLRDYGWLPDVIAQQDYLYGVITHYCSITSTLWNPMLLAGMNEQFRTVAKDLWCPLLFYRSLTRCCCICRTSREVVATTTDDCGSIETDHRSTIHQRSGGCCCCLWQQPDDARRESSHWLIRSSTTGVAFHNNHRQQQLAESVIML